MRANSRDRSSQVRIGTQTAISLRAIAAHRGLFAARGPGAGDMGNPSLLLEQLVESYQRNPRRFLDVLDVLLDGSKQPDSV